MFPMDRRSHYTFFYDEVPRSTELLHPDFLAFKLGQSLLILDKEELIHTSLSACLYIGALLLNLLREGEQLSQWGRSER